MSSFFSRVFQVRFGPPESMMRMTRKRLKLSNRVALVRASGVEIRTGCLHVSSRRFWKYWLVPTVREADFYKTRARELSLASSRI